MELNEAISILKIQNRTDKAAAAYVGYTPEYYYSLLAAGEKMPKKARLNIIRAAELLVSKDQRHEISDRELANAPV